MSRFLNRAVQNFEPFKKVPRTFFLKKFESIGLVFREEPFFHQLVCTYLGISQREFIELVDVGLGKTSIALNIIYGLKLRKLPHKALVLVPTLTNIPSWKKEVKRHRPELRFVGLNAPDRKMRLDMLEQDADVFCITYMGLVALVTSLQPHPKKEWKKHRAIDPEAIAKVMSQFGVAILDELTAVKNPRSKTFQVCQCMQTYIPTRIGLTGTPFGRDLGDLWGEYFVVDGGKSLGYNRFIFDKVFFDMKDNYFGGKDKKFRKDLKPALKRLMYNCAIRYQQDECFDLPPINHIPVPLQMPEEMEPYYSKIHSRILESLKPGHGEIESRQTLWIQKRAVTSNFLKLTDAPTGKTVTVDIPGEVKLEALLDLCTKIPDGHKMVVFHEFIYSGDKIMRALNDNQELGGVLRIQATTKNREEILERFDTDARIKFLVISSQLGSIGHNFQVANYVAFYESPVRPEVRTQAEARCYRTGQKFPVFVYDFYIEDSVEESILKFLKEGRDLYNEFMTGTADVLGMR